MFSVLHLPDFALQAVLRLEPGASLRPAALFDRTKKKSVALAATALARAAGVELGMTAPQAIARCPALVIRTPAAAAEAEARAALLATALRVSPTVEDTAPGVCTIDLKGTDAKAWLAALELAVRDLGALGLSVAAGVARTPLLALYAARACPAAGSSAGVPPASRPDAGGTPALLQLAEPAAPYFSSPLVRVITDEKTFLAPLPLATADPTPSLAEIFTRWGLRTLGEFSALPRDEIVRRFGREGLDFWHRAQGGEPRPLRPVIPVQDFCAALEWEEAIETLEPLLFLLRRFIDRLTLELRGAQFVAAELGLVLHLDDGKTAARNFRLPEPTADAEILFRTVHTHLESLQTDSPIIGLELRAIPARPLIRQQGLFETGLRDPHGFAETLARVVALVGNDRVGTPQHEETHRPDAVKLVAPAPVIPPLATPPLRPPLGLPLRRFRPPLPARLEFTPEDRRPTFLWTERFQGSVAALRGPWRSNGDWWQADRAWARLEYDIALAEGGLYRLLLIDEAWFIEGEYD